MPFLVVPPLGTWARSTGLSEQFKDKVSELIIHALRLLESPTATQTGGTAWATWASAPWPWGIWFWPAKYLTKVTCPIYVHPDRATSLLAGAALLACARGRI